MLVVEQNAAIALEVAARAYVLEVGKVAVSGTSEELARDESVRKSLPGVLRRPWPSSSSRSSRGSPRVDLRGARARARADPPRDRGDQLRAGRDGDVHDLHRLDADRRTTAGRTGPPSSPRSSFAFVLGVGIQRVVIRPVERALGADGRDHHDRPRAHLQRARRLDLVGRGRAFPSPFPNETWQIGGVAISRQDLGTIAVVLVLVVLLWAFFQFTKIGLALRASALNPDASRLVGVRVGWMLAIGWGLAAVLGAVAGMLAAPTVFLDPNDDAGDADLRLRRRGARRDRLARSARSSAGSCSASA